jgi:hypothetical protein
MTLLEERLSERALNGLRDTQPSLVLHYDNDGNLYRLNREDDNSPIRDGMTEEEVIEYLEDRAIL